MSFMQRQVIEADYFEVDTRNGVEIVPCDVCGRTMNVHVETLLNYISTPLDPDELCEVKHGWIARLSAPGYMDCTDWSAFNTKEEAEKWLDEFYGDDE